ncbi:MAG: hypothetical protein JRM80_11310 [Nitrososphaerota archaeon]|nr:hypothetical protein [Nitrososphaerota archaeon]
MIEVDCSEMDLDEQLSLAAAVSESLGEKGVALVKDAKLMVDAFSAVSVAEVARAVGAFVAKRKDAAHYSVETKGDAITVHTPDPLSRSRGRKDTGELLPPNLLKCPFCSFVTPYQEMYNVHLRSHGF